MGQPNNPRIPKAFGESIRDRVCELCELGTPGRVSAGCRFPKMPCECSEDGAVRTPRPTSITGNYFVKHSGGISGAYTQIAIHEFRKSSKRASGAYNQGRMDMRRKTGK